MMSNFPMTPDASPHRRAISDSASLGSNPSPPAIATPQISSGRSGSAISELPEQTEHGAARKSAQRTRIGRPRTKSRVYVVICEGFIKIGMSDNVPQRIREMQVGNPFQIKLARAFSVDWHLAAGIEAAAHAKLAHVAHRGEWFRCAVAEGAAAIKAAIADQSAKVRLPHRRHYQTDEAWADAAPRVLLPIARANAERFGIRWR
jgi:Meiotically up-regulated gene 113